MAADIAMEKYCHNVDALISSGGYCYGNCYRNCLELVAIGRDSMVAMVLGKWPLG